LHPTGYLNKKEIEIRFLGIDAPELNYCNKIKYMTKSKIDCFPTT